MAVDGSERWGTMAHGDESEWQEGALPGGRTATGPCGSLPGPPGQAATDEYIGVIGAGHRECFGHNGGNVDEKIVVGVDGSESSRRALSWAARQSTLTDAPLEAVISWESHPTTASTPLHPTTYGLAPKPSCRRRWPRLSATIQTSASSSPLSRVTRFLFS